MNAWVSAHGQRARRWNHGWHSRWMVMGRPATTGNDHLGHICKQPPVKANFLDRLSKYQLIPYSKYLSWSHNSRVPHEAQTSHRQWVYRQEIRIGLRVKAAMDEWPIGEFLNLTRCPIYSSCRYKKKIKFFFPSTRCFSYLSFSSKGILLLHVI